MKKIAVSVKHFFIPHKGNDFKPHLFREISLISIACISFFLLGLSASSSFFIHKTVLGASIASSVLIDLTNDNRLAYNESPLVKSVLLEQAAALKGQDMTKRGYFAHNSPDGITPWYWFRKVGYTFLYAGENLAVNFTESSDVENGWMNSPTHKANLLDPHFKEIGIATIEGVYEGNPTIFVVQMFGTPASVTKKVEALAIATTSSALATGTLSVIKTSLASTSSSTLSLGEVKGAETKVEPKKETPTETIGVSNNFLAVKTLESMEVTQSMSDATPVYSLWYERVTFSGSRYVDIFYRFLAVFMALALFVMFIVELKRQHWKHISYGLFVIVLVILFMYINKAFL